MVAIAVAAPTSAVAAPDETSLRVVPAQVQGELPAHVRQEVDARLRDSVADDAALLDGTVASACTDDACWSALATEAKASRLVQATIVVDDRDYAVRADVRDASGTVIASVDQRCEICGHEELVDTIELLGNALRRKLASEIVALPTLVVTSTPVGAWVSIDGENAGTTPLELTLAEGSHDIRVSKDGHVAQLRRVALVAGVRERVEVSLAPLPDRAPAPKQQTAMRAAGGTLLGLGLASIGAGIGLVVLDQNPQESRCDGQNVDIEGNCKYRYATLEGGIAAISVGAAALAAGIALVVVAHKRGRASRVAWMPTTNGIGLRF